MISKTNEGNSMVTDKFPKNLATLRKENGINQKTGLGLSEKTQKHYLTFISDVMLYAKRCGIIYDNP